MIAARNFLPFVLVTTLLAGCSEGSTNPLLPPEQAVAGSRSNATVSPAAPLSPKDGQSRSGAEICYEERGGGAMGSGGRVVVPCPEVQL
jgi:hypothetical protein